MCTAIGIASAIGVQLAIGRGWRIRVNPDERTELMSGAPSPVARNPIYAAMIPAFAGIALLAPNPITIAAAVSGLIALEVQARLVEGSRQAGVHGARCAGYVVEVDRFLPGIGRSRGR